MLASFNWLRSLCPVEADVRRVAEALTQRGLTVDAVTASGDDHALEIDVPANRPDCLGHLGLARELGAAFDLPFESSAAQADAGGVAARGQIRVEIEDPDLCGRYTAGLVRGVHVGPSPGWVVQRLATCGLRSVNNVVDASNLVMLELGNPIHFFDLDRIEEATIRVRRAQDAERLTTLDGEERKLDGGMLVIADARRPVALAGVIGGAESEIDDTTQDVLVEAAWFRPESVRRTARKLGIQTDASHRFGRGVDPRGVLAAQTLAARLLSELGDGTPLPGIVDVWPRPPRERTLVLRLNQLERLLGYLPGIDEVERSLAALLLLPVRRDFDRVEITVPSWRVDLEREADVVEEVARHLGYDRIPSDTKGIPARVTSAASQSLEERVRDLLSSFGFHEAFGYAMIPEGDDNAYVDRNEPPPVRLSNPIAESLAALRRSIVPGLIRAADLNHRRGVRDVRLFEVGHVFRLTGDGPHPVEPLRVGIVWSGSAQPEHWSIEDRQVGLYEMLGIVDGLISRLRPGLRPRKERIDRPGLHPGRCVAWRDEAGSLLAWAGALHPEIQQSLAFPVFAAEIEPETLVGDGVEIPQYRPLPRLTAVTRDLSLVMTGDMDYGTILSKLETVTPPAPVEIRAVDRYEGRPLGPGESSLTIRIVLQPSRETLNEAQIEGYRTELVKVLQEQLGVRIRA